MSLRFAGLSSTAMTVIGSFLLSERGGRTVGCVWQEAVSAGSKRVEVSGLSVLAQRFGADLSVARQGQHQMIGKLAGSFQLIAMLAQVAY